VRKRRAESNGKEKVGQVEIRGRDERATLREKRNEVVDDGRGSYGKGGERGRE
jgi:hypothetical protein